MQSPNELQDLLDVTRQLLDELEARQRGAAAAAAGGGATAGSGGEGGGGGAVPALDPDNDEVREKFRIMKVRLFV